MNVLVIGNGGREHALCYGIKQSPNCSNLYCIPGSDSISEIASSISADCSARCRLGDPVAGDADGTLPT